MKFLMMKTELRKYQEMREQFIKEVNRMINMLMKQREKAEEEHGAG